MESDHRHRVVMGITPLDAGVEQHTRDAFGSGTLEQKFLVATGSVASRSHHFVGRSCNALLQSCR